MPVELNCVSQETLVSTFSDTGQLYDIANASAATLKDTVYPK